MEKSSISRKDFLKNSALSLAGLAITPGVIQAQSLNSAEDKNTISGSTYTLNNVRLETGFIYENDEVTATKTELFSIEIANGKIKK